MAYNIYFTGYSPNEISVGVLTYMRSVILQAYKLPDIVQWARKIVSGCRWKDEGCEIEEVYYYVQAHSRYVHDPLGTEYFLTPLEIKHIIVDEHGIFSEDCDGLTVFSLTLLRALGYRTKLRAVNFKPGPYTHVYGIVYLGKQEIAIDEIKINGYPGFEKPYYSKLDMEV